LIIDGKVSKGIRFRHADGTPYGSVPSPILAEASAKAFAGLRNLGFTERTARASLQGALASAPANATAESLLRSAIARASG
jgi:Holliday junction resolvasome RuvABC DNA-binding subunit